MSITTVAQQLNKLAKQTSFQISGLQNIRTTAKGIGKSFNDLFSNKTIFESDHYAYHHGGRKELQFNIGLEQLEGGIYLRYGLGLSYEPSQTVPDPLQEMESKRIRFKEFISSYPQYCDAFQMWFFRGTDSQRTRSNITTPFAIANPQLHDFYFFGKLSSSVYQELTEEHLEEVLEVFDLLLPMYQFIELGQNDVFEQPQERVARICWNDLNWKRPSGMEGKSTTKKIHTTEYGYGHEEWLFDFDKIIDGYHFGFLEPVRKQLQAYANRTFNVTLYTHNRAERQWYWIARINGLQVIDKEESKRVFEAYEKRGWIEEFKNDLKLIGADIPQFERNWANEDLFNVKFKYQDVDFFEGGAIPFDRADLDRIAGGTRYSFYYKKDEISSIQGGRKDKGENGFQPNPPKDDDSLEDEIRQIKRTFTEKEVSHPALHARIQNAFHQYLEQRWPGRTQRESPAFGNTKIDLKFQDQDGHFIYFEVKSYNNPLTSIRVALGQLLEYGYYTDETQPKELIIVTHKELKEPAANYLRRIREQFSIPIGYIHFDFETKEILQKINTQYV